jgi:streptogramin lyase
MKKKGLLKLMLTMGVTAFGLAALFMGLRSDKHALAGPIMMAQEPTPQASFLFRFDPATQTFYTHPLPLGSLPHGVAVTGTSPTHVWVAEYGRGRIGHLIYTNTGDVAWLEYPVTSTSNSGPFRLTLDGNFVWFTERGANRIGRLDATTGEIVEFYGHGLSPSSGLADIRVSPDGWVWAAGQSSSRLVRLVVTSTFDYAFHEYTDALMMGPFALEIELGIPPSYDVWFTAPWNRVYKVGKLQPALEVNPFLFPQGFYADSIPYEAVFTPGYVWLSDLGRNSIDQIEIGTYTIVNLYGPVSHPAGLAKESSNVFWMTLQDDRGGLARFVYTSTVSTRFDSFALPIAGLRPTGIAVAPDSGIWFAAFALNKIYLPVVLKS